MAEWKKEPSPDNEHIYQASVRGKGVVQGYEYAETVDLLYANPAARSDDDVNYDATLSRYMQGPGLVQLYSDEFEEGFSQGFHGYVEDKKYAQTDS